MLAHMTDENDDADEEMAQQGEQKPFFAAQWMQIRGSKERAEGVC